MINAVAGAAVAGRVSVAPSTGVKGCLCWCLLSSSHVSVPNWSCYWHSKDESSKWKHLIELTLKCTWEIKYRPGQIEQPLACMQPPVCTQFQEGWLTTNWLLAGQRTFIFNCNFLLKRFCCWAWWPVSLILKLTGPLDIHCAGRCSRLAGQCSFVHSQECMSETVQVIYSEE